MAGALTRYRAMAWIVGIMLILLVLVAMPLKYFAGDPLMVAVIGPIHGFLYMVYLVASFDLFRRADWPLKRLALMILAGLVPFLSFIVERQVTREIRTPVAAR
jgi:integral membrane protein